MYEYKIETTVATQYQLMTELTQLGRLGWQLVSCEREGNMFAINISHYTLILMKRI